MCNYFDTCFSILSPNLTRNPKLETRNNFAFFSRMNVLKSLAIAFVLLISNAAYSQTASKIGNVYQIPFATEGNRVDLEVANVGDEEMAAVRVVTSQKPEWLQLDMNEIVMPGVQSDTDAIASFGFSVDREAPIGEGALLRFDILSGNKVIGVKSLYWLLLPHQKLRSIRTYPNPFSQTTTIGFDNPAEGPCRLVSMICWGARCLFCWMKNGLPAIIRSSGMLLD